MILTNLKRNLHQRAPFTCCQTRFLGATRLSFALAHDVRRLSATLTDILTSVGGSSPNTLSCVFTTDCVQSTNKKPPFQVEWLFSANVADEAENFIFHPKQKLTRNPDGTLTVKFRAGG